MSEIDTTDHLPFLKETWRRYYLEVMRPNLIERHIIYQKMRNNPNGLFALEVREKARRDVVFFFNYFLWIFESKPAYRSWYGVEDGTLPFVLMDFQIKFVLRVVDSIKGGHTLLLEKSREMGASYMVLCIFLWFFIQEGSAFDFLVGAHKFEVVDKRGVKSTLFEKLRFNIDKIEPLGLMPDKYNKNDCDNVGLLKTAKDGGASIVGEANNPNYGRSARYAATLMDEFSFWDENDSAAWTATGETCGCRIVVSTPHGFGRKFTDLRFDGTIEVITLHWTDHPLKSAGRFIGDHPYFPDKKNAELSPWYLWKCSEIADDPEANIGQELDIDYLTTGFPYFRDQMPHIVNRYKELKESSPEIKRYEFELDNNIVKLLPYPNGRISIVAEPVSGWKYRYLIAADTAEGYEWSDNNCFYVYDRVTKKDVAWFAGQCDTHVFALLLAFFGFKYEKAYIAPEKNNTSGGAVLNELKYCYSYLMYEQDFNLRIPRDKARLGWGTNVSTRGTMLGTLRQALAEKCEGIEDVQFYSEATTFVVKNGKQQAETGKKDDRIITQGIKFMLHNWLPSPDKVNTEVDKFKGRHSFGIKPNRKRDPRQIWVK